jgi:hypothetical protein
MAGFFSMLHILGLRRIKRIPIHPPVRRILPEGQPATTPITRTKKNVTTGIVARIVATFEHRQDSVIFNKLTQALAPGLIRTCARH